MKSGEWPSDIPEIARLWCPPNTAWFLIASWEGLSYEAFEADDGKTFVRLGHDQFGDPEVIPDEYPDWLRKVDRGIEP